MNLNKVVLIGYLVIFCTIDTNAQNKIKIKENCGNTKNTTIQIKQMETTQLNVLGTPIKLASTDPMTGFFRTGYCTTDANDRGLHVVAAVVTDAFLQYSLKQGNNLITNSSRS